MAGTPQSFEIFNTREEAVSSDLVRAQLLASREAQNVQRDMSRGDSGTGVTAFGDVANSGNPISGMDLLPTLTPTPGTYNIVLGPGSGFFDDAGGITADDSAFRVLRWPQQTLTFANPDAANPRIDLVVATPGVVQGDNQSRNILLDPVTRTTAAQSVPKTSNPVSTIAVIAGTPGATPVPPAVPAGAVAVFEVWVPALAADATTFRPSRRLWRRQVGLLASYHGIVQGIDLTWSEVEEATTSSTLSLAAKLRNKVVIDGELLSFGAGSSGTQVFQDAGGANPFGASAPANNDRPYFIYAVGGRHAPQLASAGNPASPIALVESLTAPDTAGRPSAAILNPRGGTTQAGAVFVGIGFVVRNSTRRKGLFVRGDMFYALTGVSGVLASFNEAAVDATPAALPLASKPSICSVAEIVVRASNAGVAFDAITISNEVPDPVMTLGSVNSEPATNRATMRVDGGTINVSGAATPGDWSVVYGAYGFQVPVPRLGP